jgi:hypothetical protein
MTALAGPGPPQVDARPRPAGTPMAQAVAVAVNRHLPDVTVCEVKHCGHALWRRGARDASGGRGASAGKAAAGGAWGQWELASEARVASGIMWISLEM